MIQIKSSKLLLKCERFRVEQVNYGFAEGETYQKEIIRHNGAVVILAIDSEGRAIFVSQPRIAINQELLELPAGTKNPSEDPAECARRELAEEVGVKAESWSSMGDIFPAPGFCDEQLFLYVAKDLSEYQLPQDSEERITIQRYTKAEVNELISSGKLKDAKSLALIYKAQLAGVF